MRLNVTGPGEIPRAGLAFPEYSGNQRDIIHYQHVPNRLRRGRLTVELGAGTQQKIGGGIIIEEV